MASTTVLARPIPRTPSPPLDSRRQSYISSSAASYQTARTESLGPGSYSSRSSSAHTLGGAREAPSPPSINPIHAMSHQQPNGARPEEVHIVKVTGDTVQFERGPVPDTFLQKVGHSLSRAIPSSQDDINHSELHSHSHVGPPPPSPPASVERIDEEYTLAAPPSPPRMRSMKTEPLSARPVTFEEPLSKDSRRSAESGRNSTQERNRVPDLLHRSSTDTRTSLSTMTSGTSGSRGPRRRSTHSHSDDDSSVLATDTPNTTEASGSTNSKTGAYQSPDGHLQPPPMSRPTRRNTTGSSPRPKQYGHAHASSQPSAYEDGEIEVELASDIQLQAEQIRRERISKRAKAQQEAEAALTRSQSMKGEGGGLATVGGPGGRGDGEAQVLVGNLIGEDHVNYVLMYNMLTGIRIAVSRCQAKMTRPLTAEDFTARHKFSFDIIGNELTQRPFYKNYSTGNELTPSAKYDFKFKDYAPWVFRDLREEYFHLDPADYLLSLTAKYILSELGSPGKSGSFFYFSRDYRFIIKTIRHSEAKFLLKILPDYHAHVKSNPHTLLSRFYGLHRVKLPRGRKIHFVIMNNLFPAHKDVHETFDLKGSTVGREYPEEMAAEKPRAVLKDLNWINRGRTLDLGPEKRALLTEQLRRDSELLKNINVMDYSLLVGIHNMQRGNKDNVRSNTLKVFSPEMPPMRRKPTALKGSKSPEAIAMRRAMRESDPKKLGVATIKLPEEDTGDRQSLIFYQDEGGLRATDEANEQLATIYYLGVIDILTPYSMVKKLEHFWKGMSADRHKISPVEPEEYGDRFFSFMKAIMRGGGGGEKFKPES